MEFKLATHSALWVMADVPVSALIQSLILVFGTKGYFSPLVLFFSSPVPELWLKWKSRLYVYFDKVDIVEHLCFVLHRILKMFHHSVCTFMETQPCVPSFYFFILSINPSFLLPRLRFLAFVNVFTFCSFLLTDHLFV